MRPIDADAALKALRKCQTYLYDARDPELKIELSSAEAAINNLSTIQPEKAQLSQEGTTSDLISRQAAIDEMAELQGRASSKGELTGISKAWKRIKKLPPIQPERKKGEWLPDNNNAYEMRFVCSCCKESEVVPTIGFTKYKPLWDFCPNCGADMRGEKDG